ncbi:hypothetical protein V6N12_045474 [Hibiscus sabdariffa]|uniref:Uncharacterized protein n=1 Tax=Hibiscus sabdariffa TaxID=183260 RepID=A0ABR2G2U8_9ROSI
MHYRFSHTDTRARVSVLKANFGGQFYVSRIGSLAHVLVPMSSYPYGQVGSDTDLSYCDPPYRYGIMRIDTAGRGPFDVKFCMAI